MRAFIQMALALIGGFVVVLWLFAALGSGHFMLHYGPQPACERSAR